MYDGESVKRCDCGSVETYRAFNEPELFCDDDDGDDREFDDR